MAEPLRGGTAVVTGAAAGIGQATALAFVRNGVANIALGDVAEKGLQETANLIGMQSPGVRILAHHVDITNETSVEKFYEDIVTKFGRIDFAANIAGYGGPSVLTADTSEAEWDKIFAVNQRGTFLCQRAQLRQMLKQTPLPGLESRGSIVNVASLSSAVAQPGLVAYTASKHGIVGLTKVDAFDFGPEGIRVNSVSPGATMTAMVVSTLGDEVMKKIGGMTPLRRLARPEEIAEAIVWLSGPMAQYITGVNLPVDGGFNLATGP